MPEFLIPRLEAGAEFGGDHPKERYLDLIVTGENLNLNAVEGLRRKLNSLKTRLRQ